MQTCIIEQPLENDIMPWRGCGPNNHPGNIYFRSLASSKAKAYTSHSTTPEEKKRIISGVIEDFESKSGRFLTKDSTSGLVRVMSDSEKGAKVGQAIRDASKEKRKKGKEVEVQQVRGSVEDNDGEGRKVRRNSIRFDDLITAPSRKRSSLNASMMEVLMMSTMSIDLDATTEDNDIEVDPNFIRQLNFGPQDLNKSQEEYFSRRHTFHCPETLKPFNPRLSAPPSYNNSDCTNEPLHEQKNNDHLLQLAVGQGEESEAPQVQRSLDIHHQVQNKDDGKGRKVSRSNSIRCEDLIPAPSKSVGKRNSLNASMMEVLMMSAMSLDLEATTEDNDIEVDPNFIHQLDLGPQDLNKSQEEYFSQRHTLHMSETPKPFNPRHSAPPSYNYSENGDEDTKLSSCNHFDDNHQLYHPKDDVASPSLRHTIPSIQSSTINYFDPPSRCNSFHTSSHATKNDSKTSGNELSPDETYNQNHQDCGSSVFTDSFAISNLATKQSYLELQIPHCNNNREAINLSNNDAFDQSMVFNGSILLDWANGSASTLNTLCH